jgi:hypothetical protein
MEKRGDIEPGRTPPEVAACHERVDQFKQMLFTFANKSASDKTRESQIQSLDSDFRKNAADNVAAHIH